MSRVYFTATFQHNNLPIPTFSFETNDHTGGGYEIAGLHPSSIAAILGKPPDVRPGERFDLKFNLNKQRTSMSLVVFTTKHLPHVEWSSDGGLGRLPLAGMSALATQFFKKGSIAGVSTPSTSKKTVQVEAATGGSSSARHTQLGNKRLARTGGERDKDGRRRHSSTTRSGKAGAAQQRQPRTLDSRRHSGDDNSNSNSHSHSKSSSSRSNPAADGHDGRVPGRRRKDELLWNYDSGYASDEASSGRRGRGRRGSKSGGASHSSRRREEDDSDKEEEDRDRRRATGRKSPRGRKRS